MKFILWWKLSSDESWNCQRREKEWWLVTFRLWRCFFTIFRSERAVSTFSPPYIMLKGTNERINFVCDTFPLWCNSIGGLRLPANAETLLVRPRTPAIQITDYFAWLSYMLIMLHDRSPDSPCGGYYDFSPAHHERSAGIAYSIKHAIHYISG